MLRRRRLKGRAPARVRPGREVGRLAGGALLAVGVPLHRVDQIAEEGGLFGDGRAVRGLAAPLEGARVQALEQRLDGGVARPPARRRREGLEARERPALAQHRSRYAILKYASSVCA